MRKIVIFSGDSIKSYYQKGEIKPRYFNPGDFFDEVHIISLSDKEIEEEKVKEIVGKAELKIYPIGSFSSNKPWKFWRLRKESLSLVSKINPDVIRAYNSHLMGYLASFCGKKLRIPVVISIHTNLDERRFYIRKRGDFLRHLWLYFSKKVLEPFSLSNASKVICVSRSLKSYAKKYRARDIVVIYNKVYSEQFYIDRQFNKEEQRLNVLCVGRLEFPKNQECLIKAIKNLNVELVLVGNGKNYNKLKGLAERLSISGRVKFIRSVPNRKIQEYYWGADIFAISSFYEGFCIPVLEAMASSLPVVVNDKEPLTEILGGTGLVVENNPESFRKAFEKLISSPELRKELGQRAKKRALELDGYIMEKKEAMLYKNLIERYSEKR